jgi:hypothetical protein
MKRDDVPFFVDRFHGCFSIPEFVFTDHHVQALSGGIFGVRAVSVSVLVNYAVTSRSTDVVHRGNGYLYPTNIVLPAHFRTNTAFLD